MNKFFAPLTVLFVALALVFASCNQAPSTPQETKQNAFHSLSITQKLYSEYEPDPVLSPGAIDPSLMFEVLTAPGFTTKNYRNVPQSEKKQVYAEYHILNHKPGDYEVDHIISLELGGSNDIKNLWPQPYHGLWNAHIKDRLEDKLNALVRSKQITLQEAQRAISDDWVISYKKYVDPLSDGTK